MKKWKKNFAVGLSVSIVLSSIEVMVPKKVFAIESIEATSDHVVENIQEDTQKDYSDSQHTILENSSNNETNSEVIEENDNNLKTNEGDVNEPSLQNQEVDKNQNNDVQLDTANEDVIDGEGAQVKANKDIQKIVDQTKAVLQSVSYDNKNTELVKAMEKSYYSISIITNKRLEISKREGRNFNDVTREEALFELNGEYVQTSSYENSFTKIQNDIESILYAIIKNSSAPSDVNQEEYFIKKITDNKVKLLLGVSYVDRLYNFNMGNKNIRDILIYEPNFYGKQFDSLDWFIRIGSLGGDSLELFKNSEVFTNLFTGTVTDARTVVEFIELNKSKLMQEKTLDVWFRETSKAYIEEMPSIKYPQQNVSLYSKFVSDSNLYRYILPMLNVSENSIYAITNTTTITLGMIDSYVDRKIIESDPSLYNQQIEEFKRSIKEVAKAQRDFIEVWYRITSPEIHSRLFTNRFVIDGFCRYGNQYATSEEAWSPTIGNDVALGVREFFFPMRQYVNYPGRLDAHAEKPNIRYFIVKALSDRGPSTYTHELTHLLEDEVWMNQEIRDGLGAEVYSRGLFESYEKLEEPIINLNFAYNHTGKNVYHNSTPERFQNTDDIKQYMSGLYDVLYTLDYLEGSIVLKKGDEVKEKWFHKWEQIDDYTDRVNKGDQNSVHKTDKVRKLNSQEIGALKTFNDLIDNNIVVSRYEIDGLKTTGQISYNGYYIVPMFTANYAATENDRGVSGDISVRRNAYELLAEFGYYDGMVPYISNQYKADAAKDGQVLSDKYILNKIFNGKYKSMSDFKKAMFQRRIENINNLKPITISWEGRQVNINDCETLQKLMTEAIEYDLNNVTTSPDGINYPRAYLTQVEKLKGEIFREYLKSTHEFKEVIYQEPILPQKYTVKYRANEGDTIGNMEDQVFLYDELKPLNKSQYKRVGYTFAGWKDNKGRTYKDQQVVSKLAEGNGEEVVLTAQWKENSYKVKYKADEANTTGKVEEQVFTYSESKSLNKNQYKRVGYTFAGWKDNKGRTYKDQQMVSKLAEGNGEEVVLTAQWEPISYLVKFDANGTDVVGEMTDQIFRYDEKKRLSKNLFVREGYNFMGWSLEGKQLAKYKNEELVSNLTADPNTPVILYAVWEKNKSEQNQIPQLSDKSVQNLKAIANGKKSVKLTWDNVTKVDGYLIYCQKKGKYKYCGISKGNSFTDNKALDEEYNYYWVFPYITNPLTGEKIPGICNKYVYAKGTCVGVKDLKAFSSKDGVKLVWDKTKDADGYLVYAQKNGKYAYVGMTKNQANKVSYFDKNALKDDWNFYWVYPYHYADDGKTMIPGPVPQLTSTNKHYVYGKAK